MRKSAGDMTTRRISRRRLLGSVPATPPLRPTAADQPLLTYAQSCELACEALYEQALGAGGLDTAQLEAVTVLRRHHQDNADLLAGVNGIDAARSANQSIVAEYERDVTQDDRDQRVQSLLDLEERMAATHLSLLGVLEGTDGAKRIASILSAVSRRCVVLGQSSQADQVDFLPAFERVARAFSPDEFPAVAS
jgi:hypothetical protein